MFRSSVTRKSCQPRSAIVVLAAGLIATLLSTSPASPRSMPLYDKVIHPITLATWDPTHTWGLDPMTQMDEIIAVENWFEVCMAATSRICSGSPYAIDMYPQDRQAWDPVAGAPSFGGRVLLAATDGAGTPAVFAMYGLPAGWYWVMSFFHGSAIPENVLQYDLELFGEDTGGHRTTISGPLQLGFYHYGLNAVMEMPAFKIEGIRFENIAPISIFALSSPWVTPGTDTRVHFEVRDCVFENGSGASIVAWLTGKGVVADNRITNVPNGLVVAGAGAPLDAEVRDNAITGARGYGIGLTSHPYSNPPSLVIFTVENNTVELSGANGYGLGFGMYGLRASLALRKNSFTVTGTNSRGLAFDANIHPETTGVLQGNRIQVGGGAQSGATLAGQHGLVVRNNHLEGEANYGFNLINTDRSLFFGNSLGMFAWPSGGSTYRLVNSCEENDVRGFTGGLDSIYDDTDDPMTPWYDGANFLTGVTPMNGAGGVGQDAFDMEALAELQSGTSHADGSSGGKRQQ